MKILPKQRGLLLFSIDCSKILNKLILKSNYEIWFLPFSDISIFQINLNLAIASIYVDNKRFWFTFTHSEKRLLLELLDKNNYKKVSQFYYAKLEDCLYIDEKTCELVLKNGFSIKNIYRTKLIMGQINFSIKNQITK